MTTMTEILRLRSFVERNGAIILSSSIVADGHYDGATARVVTHIHNDHTRYLSRSARAGQLLVATPLTIELLEAHGHRLPLHRRIEASYGTRMRIEDYVVTLHRANHVPGAAEVVVEHPEGLRVGYTGDFKLPGTVVLQDLDVLVIDATYGKPEWRRPWQDEIEYLLADIVNEALMHGPVRIYAYNGKIEEVMILLRRMGVTAPFVLPAKKKRVVEVLERHGYRLGDFVVESSPECFEVKRGGWYIAFEHFFRWRRRHLAGPNGAVNILLSGWEFGSPYRRVGPRDWIVSFSDHADFTQLVEYVEEARPRLLVVDSSRGGEAAQVFASYVSRELGINAFYQPRES